jgi:hypothetical protein
VLAALFFGPILAYVGFGALWLAERTGGPLGWRREWLFYGTTAWVIAGIGFSVLANRWTKDRRVLLPPIDWAAPGTFAPFDRQAWDLVQEEAERSESVPLAGLTEIDTYIDTTRRLAQRLAAHYHPLSTDPLEHVAIADMLTALQLASEDLADLCREVPGGDMITPAYWKKAISAANYIQKASDLYTYLLPIFQPVTGLLRLSTQKLMVQPAWRNMQQNVMRWFFRAFVNRLGTHLIELYSGRLSVGAEHYRRLTRRAAGRRGYDDEPTALTIAVAGARDSGKSRLVQVLQQAQRGDMSGVRGRLEGAGLDAMLADRLKAAEWIEAPSYSTSPGAESARDRATRRNAVEVAADADALIIVHALAQDDYAADLELLRAWNAWFSTNPNVETPPVIMVLTGADSPELAGAWRPPHDWARGQTEREQDVRRRYETIRSALPAQVAEIVVVGLGTNPAAGVADHLLPALAALLPRAERVALFRHFHRMSSRSKARRLFTQVGRQGRRLWEQVRTTRKPQARVG